MDCHGGAAVSSALNAHAAGFGLGQPQPHTLDDPYSAAGMADPNFHGEAWAEGFFAHPPPAMAAMAHEQHMMEQMAMEQEFLAQEEAMAAHAQHQEMEAAFGAAEAPDQWTEQFHQVGDNWAQDFSEEGVQVFTVAGENVVPFEEKMRESKFYDLMNKIRSGEVMIEEGTRSALENATAESFLNEFAHQQQNQEAEAWASEMTNLNGMAAMQSGGDETAAMEEAWGETDATALEDAWGEAENMDEFSAEYLGGHADPERWAAEFAKVQEQFNGLHDATDYPFDPNNPYLFHDNPFAEGETLLRAGTVSEAVLAFEAAVQKEPSNARYWQTLGTTQAENEKDQHAIKALNKARELEPTNLATYMALAVSHTNEGNQTQALRALRDWIRAHPEHDAICGFMEGMTGGLPPADSQEPFHRDFMFISPSEHREVCALYDAATEMNPGDAELHIGLGILRNLSHEFDLAAQCFERALNIRPTDPKLWNKLGATLANGNRSREALNAYDRALDLNPGYVRAQYNLGVSYSNLGEHEQAVRQFLRAIVMQQGGVVVDGEPGSNRSTRELWDVLRMTLNLMERPDLVSLAWKQDCRPFLAEFGLQDLGHQ